MEENNTEYTETETATEPGTEETSSGGYPEETTETADMEEGPGTDAGEGTEESGDNGNDTSDSTDSDTDDGTLSGTGADTAASSGASPDNAESPSGTADGDLLESLNALVKALSPEEGTDTGESEGTGGDISENGSAGPEISEHDTQTLEALQSINTTLAAIQAENELWHTETLQYREETEKTQESIIVHLETASLLLIAVGFFVALQCGGKFADIFFRRMKGDEHV